MASFQNVDSCKQILLIFFFSISLPLFHFVCKNKKKALGSSLFKTKYNNAFNGKYWLWASIKEEACLKCGFMEMKGAFLILFIVYLPEMRRVRVGEVSPGITAVITYLLHGHACQFSVQLFLSVTPLWMEPANNMEMCLWKLLELPPLIGQLRSHPVHFIVLQPDISQELPWVQNRLFMWLPACDSSLAAGQTIDEVLWELFVLTKIDS